MAVLLQIYEKFLDALYKILPDAKIAKGILQTSSQGNSQNVKMRLLP